DVYDFAPSYQGGGTPAVTADAIDDMVRLGVRTVYLQAAQVDERSPDPVVDPGAVARFLVRAQRAGLRVVAWYLPRLADIDRDLAHLDAIADFEVLGHRFDGVAVDIEWTSGVPDHAARSAKLVELSERLREQSGDDVLGAIVLPPVQIEVVNPAYWPDFPWKELAPSYDVWLPMGYWTERTAESGYQDGRVYTDENVRRIRANLGDEDAPVHAIGGIGDKLTPAQATGFVEALTDTEAIGGSIYDWATLSTAMREHLAGMAEAGGD
ncbi:MAG TPA: hypothetical protein VIL36_12380, partial [Acidimicrobiales bacterium]